MKQDLESKIWATETSLKKLIDLRNSHKSGEFGEAASAFSQNLAICSGVEDESAKKGVARFSIECSELVIAQLQSFKSVKGTDPSHVQNLETCVKLGVQSIESLYLVRYHSHNHSCLHISDGFPNLLTQRFCKSSFFDQRDTIMHLQSQNSEKEGCHLKIGSGFGHHSSNQCFHVLESGQEGATCICQYIQKFKSLF